MGISAHARAATYSGLLVLLITSQGRAEVLVEYTFGDSVATATNLPQSVAANLSATPVIGIHPDTQQVVPHSFTEWSPGNMAMRLTQQEGPAGARMFRITLLADPGFTFQLTDASFTYQAFNTAGVFTSVEVWPNLDPVVGFSSWSSGDFTVFSLGPGHPLWRMTIWNAFVQRTDLTSLVVEVTVAANSGNWVTDLSYVRISGNVLPVPALGDLNCDGAVNAFDIDPFALALIDPDAYAAAYPNCDRLLADCDQDGSINGLDTDSFVICIINDGCP